jgi:hypothetical protein
MGLLAQSSNGSHLLRPGSERVHRMACSFKEGTNACARLDMNFTAVLNIAPWRSHCAVLGTALSVPKPG